MSRKGNCIDNAATEQLFGHVKDEFYRGREWGSFEDFKRDLEEYIAHWNTRRRQVKLKGPDAGGVPEPGPCGVVAIYSVQEGHSTTTKPPQRRLSPNGGAG